MLRLYVKEKEMATLLVTGASGHLGRRVVELLLEANVGEIIATTRSPEKLTDFRERGVTVRHADFNHFEGLVEAFRGAERLLLISTDTMDKPGMRIQQHHNAVKAAEAAGVRHVVYTSIANPEPGSPMFVAPDHYSTEQALEASNLGYTILRNNLYMENIIRTVSQAIQMEGKIFSATGEGKVAYITREDCAQAAFSALASSFEGRRILDISGSESISHSDLAAIATSVLVKQIAYVPLQLETLIDNIAASGLPRPVAEQFASFDAGIAEGVMDVKSNDFETLTGRKPTDIREFLTENRNELLKEPTVQ
jgi:NAD(P)H dehydrogenase (quinone)